MSKVRITLLANTGTSYIEVHSEVLSGSLPDDVITLAQSAELSRLYLLAARLCKQHGADAFGLAQVEEPPAWA